MENACAICGSTRLSSDGAIQHQRWCGGREVNYADGVRYIRVRDDGSVFAYDEGLHWRVNVLTDAIEELKRAIESLQGTNDGAA